MQATAQIAHSIEVIRPSLLFATEMDKHSLQWPETLLA